MNPYRKHSEEMIAKLESAGLGFYASQHETRDRIGQIPMRQLVYRVQPLPTSLQPLVWDFGQLDASVERSYIRRLVYSLSHHTYEAITRYDETELELIIDLLGVSQGFMRERKDECSFVSIRDIERCLQVCRWFFAKKHLIFVLMDEAQQEQPKRQAYSLSHLMRAFCLSLMVCYHSCLFGVETRRLYRELIMGKFPDIPKTTDWLFDEMNRCQTFFIDQIDIDKKNKVDVCCLLSDYYYKKKMARLRNFLIDFIKILPKSNATKTIYY